MMKDTYNEQIELLLANNYKAFGELVGADYPDAIDCDYMAWGNTGDNPESIFAYLPGTHATCCASQIERDDDAKEYPELYNKLVVDSEFELIDVLMDRDKYTREELEEFARRQRIARGIPQ